MNNETFFDREGYFKFIDAWKAACKDERAKTHYKTNTVTVGKSTYEQTLRYDSWLTAAHHVLYNVVRGRNPKTGFAPLTNEGRLNANQNNPYYAHTIAELVCYKKGEDWVRAHSKASHTEAEFNAKFKRGGWTYEDYLAQHERACARWKESVEKFLEPFGDAFTGDDLYRACQVLADWGTDREQE